MSSNFDFKGVLTALVTPFRGGRLDLESFEKLVEFQLKAGIQGLVVGGTTGESPCLDPNELGELFGSAKELASGKVPLVVGTGSNSTSKTTELTRKAADWGADAALVVVPYYNKPPQRGLVAHFQAIADAAPIPIILYNVPGRTQVSLSLESILILSRHPRIVGIKDATGDLSFAEALRTSAEPHFLQLSGDDGSCMDYIRRGGHGVISVISNLVPGEMVKLSDESRRGANIAQDFLKYSEILRLLFLETNPIPVKMALHLMGILRSPEMRLPLVEMTPELRVETQRALERQGLIQ